MTKLAYMIFFGRNYLISEISALITQIETTTANAFVCHKFLEVEVNCQKSVCTESRESRDAKQ